MPKQSRCTATARSPRTASPNCTGSPRRTGSVAGTMGHTSDLTIRTGIIRPFQRPGAASNRPGSG